MTGSANTRARTYSVAELSRVLGVSENTIRRSVAAGDIPRVPYLGRRIRISEVVVNEMLASVRSS